MSGLGADDDDGALARAFDEDLLGDFAVTEGDPNLDIDNYGRFSFSDYVDDRAFFGALTSFAENSSSEGGVQRKFSFGTNMGLGGMGMDDMNKKNTDYRFNIKLNSTGTDLNTNTVDLSAYSQLALALQGNTEKANKVQYKVSPRYYYSIYIWL